MGGEEGKKWEGTVKEKKEVKGWIEGGRFTGPMSNCFLRPCVDCDFAATAAQLCLVTAMLISCNGLVQSNDVYYSLLTVTAADFSRHALPVSNGTCAAFPHSQ